MAVRNSAARRIVGSDRLSWRIDVDGGLSLHFGRRTSVLARVVPDREWPHTHRVRFVDGTLSDKVNLTRAKDAARAAALRDLNFDPQEWAVGARPFAKMGRPILLSRLGAPHNAALLGDQKVVPPCFAQTGCAGASVRWLRLSHDGNQSGRKRDTAGIRFRRRASPENGRGNAFSFTKWERDNHGGRLHRHGRVFLSISSRGREI